MAEITKIPGHGGFPALDDTAYTHALMAIGDNSLIICTAAAVRSSQDNTVHEQISYRTATVATDGTVSDLGDSANGAQFVGSGSTKHAQLNSGAGIGAMAVAAYKNDWAAAPGNVPATHADIGLIGFGLANVDEIRTTVTPVATVAADFSGSTTQMPAVAAFADGSLLVAWIEAAPITIGGIFYARTLRLHRYTVDDPTIGSLHLANSTSVGSLDFTAVAMAAIGADMVVAAGEHYYVVTTSGAATRFSYGPPWDTHPLPMTPHTQLASNDDTVIVAVGDDRGLFALDEHGELSVLADVGLNFTPLMDSVGGGLLVSGQLPDDTNPHSGPATYLLQFDGDTLIAPPQGITSDQRPSAPYFALVAIRLLHDRSYVIVADNQSIVYALASDAGWGGKAIEPYLRMGQRNDGMGPLRHPRLDASVGASTSLQTSVAPRVARTNRYR